MILDLVSVDPSRSPHEQTTCPIASRTSFRRHPTLEERTKKFEGMPASGDAATLLPGMPASGDAATLPMSLRKKSRRSSQIKQIRILSA